MKPHLSVSLALLLAAATHAADTGFLYSVVTPRAPAVPGATIELQVAALNATGESVTPSWPEQLKGEMIVGDRRWPVALRARVEAAAAPARLAAGSFALRTYTVTLPPTVPVGAALLELRVGETSVLRTGVELAAAPPTPAAVPATPEPARPTTNLARVQPAASVLRHTFADRLGAHEPIYFIYGGSAPSVKFQFSFKYKVLDFAGLGAQRMARSLQFAFTQRSLWDIRAESSPFYDTSYMPELMYESLTPKPDNSDQWFTWLGLQAAVKHESNGRDGPMSRSLNTVYARPVFAFGALEGWHLLVIPEVFTYITSLDDNPYLTDYRGYGRLNLVFGRNDGPSLMVTTWAGKDLDHKSIQLDLTVPVRTHLLEFETYLLIQYFDGYGESLRDYTKHSGMLRAGFSLVR